MKKISVEVLAGVKFLLKKERMFFFRGFRRVRETVAGRPHS